MKTKRTFAVLIAVCVLFSVAFSVIFPSAQANHVHEKEETCPICATIQECNELFRSLSTAVSASEDDAAPKAQYLRACGSGRRARASRLVTPVSLKVKLSD